MSIPRYGCLGEHPAPLPRGRGAACVNWAIITGETRWGDTIFKMEDRYDVGEVFAQKFFDIEPYDDVKTVYDKVARSSAEMIRENIRDWSNGSFRGMKQDENLATYYKRRTPADGLFDFSGRSVDIYNHIRGQAKPYPGAFFMQGGKKVTVWKSQLENLEISESPGVMEKCDDGGLRVACGDGRSLKLLRIQVEGQAEIWGNEFDC